LMAELLYGGLPTPPAKSPAWTPAEPTSMCQTRRDQYHRRRAEGWRGVANLHQILCRVLPLFTSSSASRSHSLGRPYGLHHCVPSSPLPRGRPLPSTYASHRPGPQHGRCSALSPRSRAAWNALGMEVLHYYPARPQEGVRVEAMPSAWRQDDKQGTARTETTTSTTVPAATRVCTQVHRLNAPSSDTLFRQPHPLSLLGRILIFAGASSAPRFHGYHQTGTLATCTTLTPLPDSSG
jgi:hypothetical protein